MYIMHVWAICRQVLSNVCMSLSGECALDLFAPRADLFACVCVCMCYLGAVGEQKFTYSVVVTCPSYLFFRIFYLSPHYAWHTSPHAQNSGLDKHVGQYGRSVWKLICCRVHKHNVFSCVLICVVVYWFVLLVGSGAFLFFSSSCTN
jgi:hypothetical protein